MHQAQILNSRLNKMPRHQFNYQTVKEPELVCGVLIVLHRADNVANIIDNRGTCFFWNLGICIAKCSPQKVFQRLLVSVLV